MRLPWIARLFPFLLQQPKELQDATPSADLVGSAFHFITLGGSTVTLEGVKTGVRHLSLELWKAAAVDLPPIGTDLSNKDLAKCKAQHLSSIQIEVDTKWQAWTWSVDKGAGGDRSWQCKTVWVSYLNIGMPTESLNGAAKPATHLTVFVGKKSDVEEQWNVLTKISQQYAFLERPGYETDNLGQAFRNWPRSYYNTEPLVMADSNNSNTFRRYLLVEAGLPQKEPSGVYPGALMPTESTL